MQGGFCDLQSKSLELDRASLRQAPGTESWDDEEQVSTEFARFTYAIGEDRRGSRVRENQKIDAQTIEIERLRQEIRMENRKFAVQIVLALMAALGVGVAIGRFWLFHA